MKSLRRYAPLSDEGASANPRFAPTEDIEDLYEHAPCGYLSLSPNGVVVKVNKTLGKWTGFETSELVGVRFHDLLNIAGRIYLETHLLPLLRMQGFVDEVALDLVKKDTHRLPILVNAVERKDAVGNLLFIRVTVFNAVDRRRYEQELLVARAAADAANESLKKLNESLEQRVTEGIAVRIQLEDSLRQSQKMEAIGQLTGGIAHDFNNLLAGIGGSIELLGTRIKQGRLDTLQRYIEAAAGAVSRAAALTQRLLAFSRQQELAPKAVNINRLVMDMEELIRRTVGPGVALEVVGAGGLWPSIIDPNQLENALLNLCINARDAMPGGGRLTIETANKWLDDRTAKQRDLPPGQYVTVSVTDTGTGMTPEVIAHAFEPFFTTKAIGSGTGLGLSMVFGFARQSGGQVRVYSEVGRGTTMTIYLPRHLGEVVIEETGSFVLRPQASTEGVTVLIVDDEPTVRLLVTEVVEDCGYHAIEAADGHTAVKILKSNVDIDLLITDVGLPGGMSGRQVADSAREARADLKVLFMTGYADNAALGGDLVEAGAPMLTKPFTIEALMDKINCLLAGSNPSTEREV
jgi:signal transduction histidine kinase/CheY-like chemotaxis protein